MRALPLLLLLLDGACAPDTDDTDTDSDTVALDPCDPRQDPGGDPLAGAPEVTLVQDGFQFLEGPVWRCTEARLLFSDIPANTIFALQDDAVTVFRQPSGNANGLVEDTEHRLLAAEHGNRRVSRTADDGTVTALADTFEGSRLNSPNDLAVRSDGTIYVSDPPYGISAGQQELDFNGVFRIAPDGTLTAEWRGPLSDRPNGVILSPDEQTLYVADSQRGTVHTFAVNPDGSLADRTAFALDTPSADGLAMDVRGDLYVTTTNGVAVYASDGTRLGTIPVPQQPANATFGDDDRRTLYVTARTGLYRVRLGVPGR